MQKWRDLLKTLNSELDHETQSVCANGHKITEDGTFTEYGHAYLLNELRILGQCLDGVAEEILFIQGLIERDGDDPVERELLDRLMAKAVSDQQHVLRYKRMAEEYYTRFANLPPLADDDA